MPPFASDVAAPYCGQPPAPEHLLGAWNTDWRLLLGLALLACCVRWAQQRVAFSLGWLLLVVAFVSPLCALTVSLFAARSAHHVLLLTGAAPLLAAAFSQLGQRVPAAWALLTTLLMLLAWHVPVVYGWAWQSHALYWLLQAGLLLPATVFWARIFSTLHLCSASGQQRTHHNSAITAALGQIAALAGVMGLLGAVLTFAPKVLYPAHGAAPLLYGLQPLEDQQLGGLLMWVPGFVPLAVIAAVVLRQAWLAAAAHTTVAAP